MSHDQNAKATNKVMRVVFRLWLLFWIDEYLSLTNLRSYIHNSKFLKKYH